MEPVAVLVFVAHAASEWGNVDATPLWSVAGLLAVLAIPAADGLIRGPHPYALLVRAGLAPATALLVAELTGNPGGILWWWFVGFAFVYPLTLPRRLGAVALAVVPIAYTVAAQVGVTGSDIGQASLRGGILLGVSLGGLAVGAFLADVVGRPEDGEEALQRKLAIFRAAFDNAATGSALLDLHGNFVRTNQAMEDFLGRGRRELLTMNWSNVVHPEDLRCHSSRMKRLVDGELWSFRAEGRFAMPDRRSRWGTAGMSLVSDEVGRPRFVLVNVTNVTEARQSEVELRRSESTARGLFEVAPVPLWRLDLSGFEDLLADWRSSGVGDSEVHMNADPGALDRAVEAITYLGVNHAARRLFDPESRDESSSSEKPGDAHRDTVRALVNARWAGETSLEVDTSLHDSSGNSHRGTMRVVVPMVGGRPALDSTVVAFVGNGRPADAHADPSGVDRRSTDELVATESQELRTPLTAIMDFAHELRKGLSRLTPEEAKAYVARIGDQASEVGNLVENLLVSTRVEWGDLAVAGVPVDLWAEAEAVLEARQAKAAIDRLGSEAKVLADRIRVRQILHNLITNAADHGGSRVTLRARRQADQWAFYVIDNGDGVPPEDADRIFEPYFQAGVTGSIGLGLTVSRQLARAMGGDLGYRYHNGHSYFKLSLPAL